MDLVSVLCFLVFIQSLTSVSEAFGPRSREFGIRIREASFVRAVCCAVNEPIKLGSQLASQTFE